MYIDIQLKNVLIEKGMKLISGWDGIRTITVFEKVNKITSENEI